MALEALSDDVKVTKPNPRDLPVSRSVITLAANYYLKKKHTYKIEWLETQPTAA